MKKLLFGTAGIPICARGSDTATGIAEVRNLGLDAMELEFVRSINITKEKAPLIKKSAKDNNIVLTCHAPYFINLNSLETKKVKASIQRILSSAKIANLCGGYSVCFHPGFYMKETKENTFERIKKNIKEIVSKIKDDGNKIWVRPETTGKESQFGSYEELIKISEDISQVLPCIDFSHLHARSVGAMNSYDEFSKVLGRVEKKLGKNTLNNMHIHVSGIEYGEKGERKHLILEDSDFNYKELMKALKDYKVKGVLICESPNIEDDALLMKKFYDSIFLRSLSNTS